MEESENDYRFLVETISSPSHCSKCGTIANLYKHGLKQQLFLDLPMHAKRVGIYVNRRRYRCRQCNKTFFEKLPDMDVNYLSKLQDIEKVELVAMDMWNPYKCAVNSVIPHAKIVIDKFHVVKLAYEAYEFYQNWLLNVPKELMTYFEDLIKAMSNWKKRNSAILILPLQTLIQNP